MTPGTSLGPELAGMTGWEAMPGCARADAEAVSQNAGVMG